MKIAHFDCFCGISGNKILGAFVDAGLNKEVISSLPRKLNLRDVEFEVYHH
jgi:uncharacterized protein (DUF111 family)